jgi:hypothetical protein
MAVVLLISLLGVPVVLMTVLRMNASLVFLSVCLGAVLLQFVGEDAVLFVNMFAPHNVVLSRSTVRLALLLIPVVLTMLFMIKSVKGSKLLYNILPAVGASFLLLLLVKPLLSPGTIGTINASPLWPQIERLQDLIVGMSALICLFFLWIQRPKVPDAHKKRR